MRTNIMLAVCMLCAVCGATAQEAKSPSKISRTSAQKIARKGDAATKKNLRKLALQHQSAFRKGGAALEGKRAQLSKALNADRSFQGYRKRRRAILAPLYGKNANRRSALAAHRGAMRLQAQVASLHRAALSKAGHSRDVQRLMGRLPFPTKQRWQANPHYFLDIRIPELGMPRLGIQSTFEPAYDLAISLNGTGDAEATASSQTGHLILDHSTNQGNSTPSMALVGAGFSMPSGYDRISVEAILDLDGFLIADVFDGSASASLLGWVEIHSYSGTQYSATPVMILNNFGVEWSMQEQIDRRSALIANFDVSPAQVARPFVVRVGLLAQTERTGEAGALIEIEADVQQIGVLVRP